MRTTEAINKETRSFFLFKISVTVIGMLCCIFLWTMFSSWSATIKLLLCAGLLLVLGGSFIIGILESGASVNSSNAHSQMAKLSGLANIGIAVTWLCVFGTAIVVLYQALSKLS